MKKIVIGIGSITLILIIVLIAYTVYGRSVRQKEIDNGLTFGMRKAMEMLGAKEYAPKSNEEFVALFMEAFLMNFDSNSDVTIHILDADFEKGLLSVEGVLTYKHPIGSMGTVSAVRTIILEEYVEEIAPQSCTIQFVVNGSIYKKYILKKGTKIIVPVHPKGDFLGWRKLEEEEITDLSNSFVEQDLVFVAVFR